MTVWGLVDDRTGHTGQVLGVIAKLGVPYQLKRLEYNFLRHLPNALIGASLAAVDKKRSALIAPPWPQLVIAAGRRTVPVLRYIEKVSPSTTTVYLMWPGSAQGIDLIAAPVHDEPPEAQNVITTLAPLHAVTPETLQAAQSAWVQKFAHLPKPWVALCLGGSTKHGDYSPLDWRNIINAAQRLAGHGSLLITTSRRTPKDAVALVGSLLASVPHELHRWDVDKDNPYLGMLGCADAVVVTGDSLSMCAEACVSGKPVFVYAPENLVPEKHKKLHQALYVRGLARPLDANASLGWKPTAPLDEAGAVAAEIRKRFGPSLAA